MARRRRWQAPPPHLKKVEAMLRRALLGCLIGLLSAACSENASPPEESGGRAGNTPLGSAGAGLASSSGGAAGAAVGGKASGGASGLSNVGGVGGVAASGNDTGGAVTAGGDGRRSDPIPVKDLPIIEEMPDPLIMNDGTLVTTAEQWKLRRQEMIQILEDYEYGHMPPPPGNVTATTATASRRVSLSGGLEADYRMLRLSFGPEQKLGFDLGLFTPVTTQAGEKFATLIFLTSSANDKSLADASAALSRGYAVATVPYQQLGADSSNWQKTAFFPAYPDYDFRDFSAWAWGISRAVDYLVTDAAIDPAKLMVTGVSRLGQAALLVGAFDERIALSAPVAGGMAFRFSGKEMGGGLGQGITEIVDQNTYWFGPRLPEFRNQTPRLPSDQHWLPALTAPRLFILCNSLKDQYGRAYAAVQTYQGAKPVYALLGAEPALGLNFRPGGHGMTSEDWSALLDFADQNLLKKPGTRKFDVIPPAEQLP
jgi:hypothetical protein